MHKSIDNLIMISAIVLFLPGCGFIKPTGMVSPEAGDQDALETEATPQSIQTVTPSFGTDPDSRACQSHFEARELREPYQRYQPDQPRYTLSGDELSAYLDLMGIESLCIPTEFGAPFINVDWSADDLPATGQMVSIGFEELYGGGGWSSGYLVYATYDFSIGSEYEVFASPTDFEHVQDGSIPGPITIDGVKGFVRFHRGIPMGMQMIMKTYIFPFENTYIAAVINLGAYDPIEVDNILLEMRAGRHPDLMNESAERMDLLVSSIRFR